MSCQACNDTGKMPGSDYLDCAAPGCDVANERASLEALVRSWGKMDEVDLIWRVYRYGQNKPRPITAQAASNSWSPRLSDEQQAALDAYIKTNKLPF